MCMGITVHAICEGLFVIAAINYVVKKNNNKRTKKKKNCNNSIATLAIVMKL